MDLNIDYQRVIDRVDDWIVNRSGRVILLFLVVTALFTLGLSNVSTEAGTEQFSEDVPAQNALDDVNREFEQPFVPDEGSTQLIQTGENVLSKRGVLRMLKAQHRLAERTNLRVTSTSSAAAIVARTIDPSANTLEEQIDAVEQATPSEVDTAVRTAAEENPRFAALLSNDFNRREAYASATVGIVKHSVPAGISDQAGGSGSSPLTPIQLQSERAVDSVGGDIRVFGSGIISSEFSRVIGDSLLLVVPAAVTFIVLFLIIAYRDPVDLLIGVIGLGMVIVWTFGFMGLVGIPFNQILIAVPPLLLAVGIDFGIHAINRYREERVAGNDVGSSMRTATDQLLVAFFIVTSTTVIGFVSNFASKLIPIRDFGLVASVGIVFTFLVFGVFLPALKVWADRIRQRYPIPEFGQAPLGSEGSRLGMLLTGVVVVTRRSPALFLVAVLVVSGGAGVYATDIDTSFSNEEFLPPEETPAYLDALPEPFKPSEYTITRDIHFLEDHFETSEEDTVTVYVEGPMERDIALEMIHRAGQDPPSTFLRSDRHAEGQSIVTVIRAQAERDPTFRRLVRRNDRNHNGIPDDDLDQIYDALLSSPARDQALSYITEERRSARVVYSVEADASQEEVAADTRIVADRYRYKATATGSTVVFQAISDLIFESALISLTLALGGTVVFLVIIYTILEGRPTLGIVNTVPIVVTVAILAATMRYFDIALNALTATILAITIGLGIDYSVHVVHRFADEYHEHEATVALTRTVQGTGGALTGSMLTTVSGIGVLVLAVFPAMGQFGMLTGLSVLYAYLASLLVLPPTLMLWARWVGRSESRIDPSLGRVEG